MELLLRVSILGLFFSALHFGASESQDVCLRSCGNFTVPFPFGFSPSCSADPGFLLTCSPRGEPLFQGQYQVLELGPTSLLIEASGLTANCTSGAALAFTLPPSFVLSGNNLFFVRGCRLRGSFTVDGKDNRSCETGCRDNAHPSPHTPFCHDDDCCTFNVPVGARSVTIESTTGGTVNSSGHSRSDCGYASVIYPSSFRNSSYGLELQWARPGECSSPELCSPNATCSPALYVPGYNCICPEGFSGTGFSNGTACSVVDHCLNANCSSSARCVSHGNSFVCRCPKGHEGDGTWEGGGCKKVKKNNLTQLITVPVGLFVASVVLAISICIYIKRSQHPKLNRSGSLAHLERAFKQNGSCRFFSFSSLEKATQSFNDDLRLGNGSFGTVYKGFMEDGAVVAIKRANNTAGHRIQQFVNEVTILSQVNHRNLIKLLGCCIETEVPLLVFEYVPNGNLFQHLQTAKGELLSWERRITIAAETAEALAYLHSSATCPIFHRDVKSSNILLDNKFTAKVGDFGISKLVSLEATHVSTTVHGTPGYIDPHYQQNYQLTDKSDVYSFGVVLLELITGEKPVDFTRSSSDKNLASFSMGFIKSRRTWEIVDKRLKVGKQEGAFMESVEAVAALASKCLELNKDDRPSMKVVAEELARLRQGVLAKPC